MILEYVPTHVVIAAGDAAVADVPWWGKMIGGVLLLVIGAVLGWAFQKKKFSLGEDFEWAHGIVTLVFLVAGGFVIAWSVGVLN